MIRIRLNQPFTYPAALKQLALRNLKLLRPYFHKNIRYFGAYMHCSLTPDAVRKDPALSELLCEMMEILKNRAFEALCPACGHTPEELRAHGLKVKDGIPFYMPADAADAIITGSAVRCIIRFSDISENHRISFVLELVKCIAYEALDHYEYQPSFTGACTRSITPKRIIDVIE